MQRRGGTRLAMLLMPLALVASACGGGGDEDGSPTRGAGGETHETVAAGLEPITVRGSFDLTGPTSNVGKPYSEGIADYVEHTNDEGGIDGREIDFVFSDDVYNVAKAEQLYTQYKADRPVAYMGWGTAVTEALRTAVAADETPFMSAAYAETLADPAHTPYNFFPAPSYSQQLRTVLRYIAEQEDGARVKVAVFHHDSAFGTSPLEDGRRYIDEQSLDIDFVPVKMASGATDFNPQLQNEGKGAQWIVIQNTPNAAATLIQNIHAGKAGAKVVCLNYCGDEILLELAGPSAEGVMAAMPFAPPNSGAEGLTELREFLEARGATLEDKGVHYIQGWYTMASMAAGIAKALETGPEIDGTDVKRALETISALDTRGVSPPIRFTAENHAGFETTPLYLARNGEFTRLTDDLAP